MGLSTGLDVPEIVKVVEEVLVHRVGYELDVLDNSGTGTTVEGELTLDEELFDAKFESESLRIPIFKLFNLFNGRVFGCCGCEVELSEFWAAPASGFEVLGEVKAGNT